MPDAKRWCGFGAGIQVVNVRGGSLFNRKGTISLGLGK